MPILRVMKNGKHLCTVGSNDVWMFSASVWGEIWGPELSFLDIYGGSKRCPDGESDFLIWEMPHALTKLDRIVFRFEEGTESSPKGNVYNPEACPIEEPKIEMSFPPTEADIAELESRPVLNSGLSWSISVNGTRSIDLAPDEVRQHVRLSLMWDENRPKQLRVSLSKKSLREIINRSEGEEVFREYISLGSAVEIAVGV